MAQVLAFYLGGTGAIDFLGDAAYHVVNWSPRVATLRHSKIGGRGPYTEVDEEMEITVSGATALAKLSTLQEVMDQAVAWQRGDIATPVKLLYQATASSPLLVSTVLGPVSPGAPMIELPTNFALSPVMQMIDPVIIRFKRLGWWLDGSTTDKTSSAVAHPALASIADLKSTNAKSPIVLRLSSLYNTSHAHDSFFLFASKFSANNSIHLLAANLLATTNWTAVNDAANQAKNTNILRYTPVATTESATTRRQITAADNAYRRWGIFINYRNNAAGTSFTVRGRCNATGVAGTYTASTVIPAGVSDPRWIYLGESVIPGVPVGLYFTLYCTASAASGTIDFDTIALIALDEGPSGQVVSILSGGATYSTNAQPFYVDHQLLSGPAPIVYHNSTTYAVSYLGNAVLTLSKNTTAAEAAWLACGSEQASDWVATHSTGTAYSTAIGVIQYPGYITAE